MPACSAFRRIHDLLSRPAISSKSAFHDFLCPVEPKSPVDVSRIKQQVQALGYLALTKDEFMARISDFYKYQTGVGTNILIMTIMSFIVGLSISGQTFCTFVLDNLEKFGALKAMLPVDIGSILEKVVRLASE